MIEGTVDTTWNVAVAKPESAPGVVIPIVYEPTAVPDFTTNEPVRVPPEIVQLGVLTGVPVIVVQESVV